MKISVCMIVKNEEAILKQSLESVCSYVDEIIIIDTGSTDHTKEIALAFTDKVYDFVWCNDFSAARNFSLAQASYDWVLALDADEVITDFKVGSIQGVIQADSAVVGRIKRINILADAAGEKRYIERICRFFNRQLCCYEGIIHEQVVRKDGKPFSALPVEITAEHIGYTQEVIKRTDKIARNISLLEEELAKSPEDTYVLYQLGKSYYMAKNYPKARVYFERALALPLNFRLEYVGSLVESYGYTLINTGCYAEALYLERYKEYYGNSTDYLFLMALIDMNNGRFSQALEQFLRCIGDKEGKIEGINSFLPTYNIGVIYECLGYREEAVSYYQKCGNYPAALKRLSTIRQ